MSFVPSVSNLNCETDSTEIRINRIESVLAQVMCELQSYREPRLNPEHQGSVNILTASEIKEEASPMFGTDNVAVVVGFHGVLSVRYVTDHRQMAQVFCISYGILPVIVIAAFRDHTKVLSMVTNLCI